MRVAKPFKAQYVISTLLIPLALNSLLLVVLANRWRSKCMQPMFEVNGKPFAFINVCAPTSRLNQLLSYLTFSEILLHSVLGMLIAIGATSSSFRSRGAVRAALVVGSLLPFATLLPFGIDPMEVSVRTENVLMWMCEWHLNHQRLFVAVTTLHVAAAFLWSKTRRSLDAATTNFAAVKSGPARRSI
jgi:succinate dehydrogenase hydrophobic anchor subunit